MADFRYLKRSATGRIILEEPPQPPPPEVFVCSGSLGEFWYSSNGISWTKSVSTSDQVMRAMAVNAAGRFVATGNKGRTFYSDDRGVTWTRGGDAGTADLYKVAASPSGMFVTISPGSGGGIWRSEDGGVTWLDSKPSEQSVTAFSGVGCDALGRFILGGSPTYTLWSDDGTTWTRSGYVGGAGGKSIIVTTPLGSIVTVGGPEGYFYSKDRGLTWSTSRGAIKNVSSGAAVTASGILVTVGAGGMSLYSFDEGAIWQDGGFVNSGNRCVTASASGFFLAMGDGGASFISEDNATTWTLVGWAGTQSINAVCTHPLLF